MVSLTQRSAQLAGYLVILVAATVSIAAVANAQGLDPDPGIPDTINIELTVDTIALQAQVMLYVFNDELLIGMSAGFTWSNQNLRLDSVAIEDFVDSAFDIGPFTYRDTTLATSNSEQQFLFAGVAGFSASGVDGNAGGSRLWATYYFTLLDWSGIDNDGVKIDTLKFDLGSDLLFVADGQLLFKPIWTGPVVFGSPTDVRSVDAPSLPGSFRLGQNFPNPFNPVTEIEFDLPVRSDVTLSVFNILGQEVARLVDNELSAGSYIVDWDGTSDNGNSVASGIYFYRLQAENFSNTKKMVLVK